MSTDHDSDEREDPMPMLPPEFWTWPVADRVDWMALTEHRRGLITKLLLEAERPPDSDVEREHYLTEKDLAAIYCRILELKHER